MTRTKNWRATYCGGDDGGWFLEKHTIQQRRSEADRSTSDALDITRKSLMNGHIVTINMYEPLRWWRERGTHLYPMPATMVNVPLYCYIRHPYTRIKLARLWPSVFLQAYQDLFVLLQITPTSPAPPCTLAHTVDDPSKPKLRVSSTSHLPRKRPWWTLCYRCPLSVPLCALSIYRP
jgi:hypothetical protein